MVLEQLRVVRQDNIFNEKNQDMLKHQNSGYMRVEGLGSTC